MNFATRLVAGTLLVLVLAVAVLLLAAERSLRRDLEGDIERSLESEAGLIREALSRRHHAVGRERPAPGRAARPADHPRGSTGRVRADSDFPRARSPRSRTTPTAPRSAPRSPAAPASPPGGARRSAATLLYVAVPGGPGAVRVAASLSQVDAGRRPGAGRGGRRGAAGAAGRRAPRASSPGRSIARPLTGITTAARAIAAGVPAPVPPLRACPTSTRWSRRCARCTGSWPTASTSCGGSRRRPPRWWNRWSKASSPRTSGAASPPPTRPHAGCWATTSSTRSPTWRSCSG